MAQINSLNQIVFSAKKGDNPETGVERHLTVNLKKRVVLPKPPRIHWPFSGISYFMVRNQNHGLGTVALKEIFHRSQFLGQNGSLGFYVKGAVSCFAGSENKVILALSPYPDAQQGFEYFLRLWIDDYCRNNEPKKLLHFEEISLGLASFLSESAGLIGLSLQPEIRIVEQEQTEDIDWESLEVESFLRGSQMEVKLLMTIKAEVEGGSIGGLKNRTMLQKTLEKRIKNRIATLMRESISPSIYYYERQTRLKRMIEEEIRPILKQAGQNLIFLKVDGQKPPLPEGERRVVEHQTKRQVGIDNKEEVEIHLKVALTVIHVQAFVDAIGKQDLGKAAVAEIEAAITSMTEIMEFSELGSPGNLRDRLEVIFKKRMTRMGISAEILGLSAKTPKLHLDHFFEREVTIPYTIFGTGESIDFKNKVQMSLEDSNRYLEQGYPELVEWNRDNLNRILRRELFDFSYTELVTTFADKIPQQIEAKMRKAARDIGYHLDILTIQPDLLPLGWIEPFQVNFSESFLTLVPNCSVKLEIMIRMSIPDLSKKVLAKYIARKVDVRLVIKEEILNNLTLFFHNLKPEHFYINFNSVDLGNESPDKPVRDAIHEKIEILLEDRFAAHVEIISLKQLDTELSNHLKGLMSEDPEFSLSIHPLESYESYQFQGKLKVTGVDPNGWGDFQRSINKTREDLVGSICLHLKHNLEFLPADALAYTNQKHHHLLAEKMQEFINECAFAEFGLCIQLLNFGRKQNYLEHKSGKFERKKLKQYFKEKSMFLEEEKRDLENYQIQTQLNRESQIRQRENAQRAYEAKLAAPSSKRKPELKALKKRLKPKMPDALKRESREKQPKPLIESSEARKAEALAALNNCKTLSGRQDLKPLSAPEIKNPDPSISEEKEVEEKPGKRPVPEKESDESASENAIS